MKRSALGFFAFALWSAGFPPFAPAGESGDVTQWVDPLIGTDNAMAISNGDTLPTVARPFGMASWTPQTTLTRWIYLYKSQSFHGLKLTHQPSPWIGDYGDFLVAPLSAPYNGRVFYPLDHKKESSRPYAYTLRISSPGITAEVTPTMRGGVMRFTFAKPSGNSILIDVPGLESTLDVSVKDGRVRGKSSSNTRGIPKGKPFGCYFVIDADHPILGAETWEERQPPYHVVNKTGRHAMAAVRFGDLKENRVTLRVGTSFIGFDQAERNLQTEIGGRGFDEIAIEAKAVWEKELERVRVEGASPSQLTVLYTALYRTLLYPRTFHEIDASGAMAHYSPYDGKVHKGPLYTDNGFWDTFRTLYPLFTLLRPAHLSEMLQGYVNAYREGDWMPQWQSPGYQSCMIGTHSDAVFADAVAKGIRDFDVATAYKASVKNGDAASRRGQYGRIGLEAYGKLGYVPADKVDQATSRTLEYAYDDFCLSQFASAVGNEKDRARFLERSARYKNVFNPATGFMQGRLESGAWKEPFDPLEWGREFTEGNAWHHTWFVPQDPEGLIALLGGKEAFIAKLDRLFELPPGHRAGAPKEILHDMREMVRADMGQYHHGNQPSHHIPYLYAIAGAPWKTEARVRAIMDNLYGTGPRGLIGDEDNGELSAWYLFSAMGFYPSCPGRPEYTLGSPLFKKMTLDLPQGKTLIIEAINNSPKNVYVQAVSLNGREVKGPYLNHADIAAGGTLRFVMGRSAKGQN